ncbi:MAG: geranylgeranylglyceryl/heptaprenylglyceryl phosphate synthase [Candidatus Latescibacteria bacterium]|nr:geranylgeranylglyceryl/heptaprenylglyceryl phosphate synthase [Candidatus Latescibacterota bacterium]
MVFQHKTSVYRYLMNIRENYAAGFFVLMDPDRTRREDVVEHALKCCDAGVDALLFGTSLMMRTGFEDMIGAVREAVNIPVIIFPGGRSQVTEKADAILFLSLLSGRNPEYIIGEQVRSAPVIKSIGLEAISTAYLLIESGRMTSVEFMSNTKPIPSDKPDIAVAHALAAELFGMKLVYVEAGSGAANSVPDEIIRRIADEIDIPLIVGGGIRSAETVSAKVAAGASFVVVGNHLENHDNYFDLKAFVEAAHSK